MNGVINLVTKHSGETQGNSIRLLLQDDGTFMGDYIHGGQISEDSFYRVWLRNQEYSEGILESGNPARDDGHLRKFGFRYDRELGSDLNLYIAGGGATRRLEHTWICLIDYFMTSQSSPYLLKQRLKISWVCLWKLLWAPSLYHWHCVMHYLHPIRYLITLQLGMRYQMVRFLTCLGLAPQDMNATVN